MTNRKTDIHWRYKIPTKITVLIDTREQVPMLFPSTVFISHPELTFRQLPIKVETKKTALKYGDYCIEGYEEVCAFERKASQLEIFKNLDESHDRIRQAKAFRRMVSSCKYPYLLVEASPSELLSESTKVKHPERIVHRLGLAIAKYDLRALFIPWKSRSSNVRRKIGTLMIHIMLGCILKETYDCPPHLLEEK